MPYLLALGGDQNGRFLDLSGGVTLGTDHTCEIHLRDTRVSWRHACVQADGAGASVEDLGSSDGTFVNGQPVDNADLQDGDILGIGGIRFVFLAAVPDGSQASRQDVLRPASQEINQLRQKVEEFEAFVAERADEVTRATAQLKAAKEDFAERERRALHAHQTDREALESELRDARSKTRGAEAEVALRDDEVVQLREELMESKRFARESASRIASERQRAAAVSDETVERLQKKLQESQSLSSVDASRCLELEEKIQGLEASLQESQSLSSVDASHCLELEEKIQGLEVSLQESQSLSSVDASHCLELEEKVQSLEASLQETNDESQVAATRRRKLDKKMERAEASLRQTQSEHVKATARCTELEEMVVALEGSLGGTRSELEQSVHRSRELEAELDTLGVSLSETQHERDGALSDGAASGRESAELRVQLASAEERVLNLAQELESVRCDFADNVRTARESRESLQMENARALDKLRVSVLEDAKRVREEMAKQVRVGELKAKADLDRCRKRGDEEVARLGELFDRERDSLKEEIERVESRSADQLTELDASRAESERVRSDCEELLSREQDRRHQDLLKAEEIFRGRERHWQSLYAQDVERVCGERDEVLAERDRIQESVRDLFAELRQSHLQQQSREKELEEKQSRLRAELRDAEASNVRAREEYEKRVCSVQETFDKRFAEHEQAREAERSAGASECQRLAEKLEEVGGLQLSTAWELDETRSLLEEIRRRADEAVAESERRDAVHRSAVADLEANHRAELMKLGERLRTEFSEREQTLSRDRSDVETAMTTELRDLRGYVTELKARIRLKEEELRENRQNFVERVATSASAVLRRQGVVQVPVPTAPAMTNEGGVEEGRKTL